MKDKEKQIKFSVIDNKTGKYPDLYNIALKEDWAKGLLYCDMEGFSINEDGQLILSDECGKFVYCPGDRFTVVFEDSVVLSREEFKNYCNLSVENEVLKEEKEQFENDVCNYEMNLQHLTGELEQVRKETAKKILDLLVPDCKVCDESWHSGCLCLRATLAEKIAKQFGAEIKE